MRSFTPISYSALLAVPGFESRFWGWVDRTEQVGDCWAWFGTRIHTGYGHVRCREKLLLAHRVAFVLSNRIPHLDTTKLVIHACDFRACCRPDHLRLGTHSDNNNDTKLHGRANVLRGFRHPATKVTVDTIRAIRAAAGSQSQIARRFGLTQSHVSKLRLRQVWEDVE